MASGDTLWMWDPREFVQPAANYARESSRAGTPIMAMAEGEIGIFNLPALPQNYGATTGITVIVYCMSADTSGNVILSGEFERGNTDRDSDSFAAAQSSAATAVNGTSGIPFAVTITFTNAQIDGLLAGEPLRFRLTRADSTSNGELQVTGIHVKET